MGQLLRRLCAKEIIIVFGSAAFGEKLVNIISTSCIKIKTSFVVLISPFVSSFFFYTPEMIHFNLNIMGTRLISIESQPKKIVVVVVDVIGVVVVVVHVVVVVVPVVDPRSIPLKFG